MQISSGMSRSARCRTSTGSSIERMPWPIRSAPISSASQTDSGPAASPACAVRCRPLRAREAEDLARTTPPARAPRCRRSRTRRHHRPAAPQPLRRPASPAPRRTAAPRRGSSAPPRPTLAAACGSRRRSGANSCSFHSTTPAAIDDLGIADVLRCQPSPAGGA